MNINNHREEVRKVFREVEDQFHNKFEELLEGYLWEELNLTEEIIRQTGVIPVGFDVLYFSLCNKKQFVSTVTREVLFEVGLDAPEYFGDSADITLWWKEYWRI